MTLTQEQMVSFPKSMGSKHPPELLKLNCDHQSDDDYDYYLPELMVAVFTSGGHTSVELFMLESQTSERTIIPELLC